MSITIYTKPNCVHCAATKRLFGQLGIDYTAVDFTKNPQALKFIKEKGFREAPVVRTDTEMWSGFNREKIEHLKPIDEEMWDF